MPRIFISYRRKDSQWATLLLFDYLKQSFGDSEVFMDVAGGIDPGEDFVEKIENAVSRCDILLAIIGQKWLEVKDDDTGIRRIDLENDWVRREISTALRRKILVIPILVDGASMPSSKQLPRPLKNLSRRNFLRIDHESFESDVKRLIQSLNQYKKDSSNDEPVAKSPVNVEYPEIYYLSDALPPHLTKSEVVIILAGEFLKGITEAQADLLVKRIVTEERYNIKNSSENRREFRAMLLKEKSRKVYLPTFEIDTYPVTNEHFEQFIKTTNYLTSAEKERDPYTWRSYYYATSKAKHPVVYVSWNDANAYAQWVGKRLPTIDEWEKAARGTDGRLYPWGNEWNSDLCNNMGSMRGYETTPIDMFERGKSPYGLYDMIGNVCEWSNSTSGVSAKFVMGGSWKEACELHGLPALPREAAPSLRSDDVGFRCVRDVK